jgi:hypothetical protein
VTRYGSPSTSPPTGDSALRHCSASTCEFDQVGRSSPSELVDEVPGRAVGQVLRANVLGGEAFGVEQYLGGLARVPTLTMGAGHVDKQPGLAFG